MIICLHLFASFYKNIWQLYMYVCVPARIVQFM
nr:MAG TPA: hypothetical protein [Caudoviricetes sp.]